MSAPVLSGDLRAIPLADVLLLLNNNQKTGTLRCARAGLFKSVEWEKGKIVFARSSAPEDRLGSYLMARGKVTALQVQQAGPAVGAQERLGKALIRLGVMTPASLWEAVRGQISEILYSLFRWPEGAFEFREGEAPREKIVLESSVVSLIMEATRRVDELSRIRAKIQSDRAVLAPVKTLAEVGASGGLSDFERTVLGLVDGKRTVRDVVALAGRSEFDTLQALYGLLSAGVIRVQLVAFDRTDAAAGPPARADDDVLDRTITLYGDAFAEILARARTAGGAGEIDRLRRRLRQAEFERADLLRDVAIDPDGRIDRSLLLANLADIPADRREPLLRGALDRLAGVLRADLQGKVSVDDVLEGLRRGRA
jgi:hypothetical protein